MQREGCIGSSIQPIGYVNKQFALQRDDMTKELWRQNWISFDRMWLPLSLIDFHHRHIAEAFTTWNWEELAAIERKWQSNTNNGFFFGLFFIKIKNNLFSSLWLYQMSLRFIYGELCNARLLKLSLQQWTVIVLGVITGWQFPLKSTKRQILYIHGFTSGGALAPGDIFQASHRCMWKS